MYSRLNSWGGRVKEEPPLSWVDGKLGRMAVNEGVVGAGGVVVMTNLDVASQRPRVGRSLSVLGDGSLVGCL
jgi:hypothetical protein